MNITMSWAARPLAMAVVLAAAPAVAHAAPPELDTFFICPSVSVHNDLGMWVVGQHGGYYVLIPQKGGANDGSRVFLTVPVTVTGLAQVPAGWALYSSLPSYPNFEGMAVLLAEGIDTWLGAPAGWQEGDMAKIVANGDGTYTVLDLTRMASVIIDQPIPLASAAVW
jgi:hypothetical protein